MKFSYFKNNRYLCAARWVIWSFNYLYIFFLFIDFGTLVYLECYSQYYPEYRWKVQFQLFSCFRDFSIFFLPPSFPSFPTSSLLAPVLPTFLLPFSHYDVPRSDFVFILILRIFLIQRPEQFSFALFYHHFHPIYFVCFALVSTCTGLLFFSHENSWVTSTGLQESHFMNMIILLERFV